MADNTQMTEKERGLFSLLHGLSGLLVAVVLLLSIVAALTYFGIGVQSENATNYYKIDQSLDGLKANSPDNYKLRSNE